LSSRMTTPQADQTAMIASAAADARVHARLLEQACFGSISVCIAGLRAGGGAQPAAGLGAHRGQLPGLQHVGARGGRSALARSHP
jgi:hypothetical protein